MTKKKVLICIDWFLPGDRAGGPVRSVANIIDQLGNEFDFSVITRNTDYMSDRAYPGIKPDEWNMVNGMRVYYFSPARLTRQNMQKLIEDERSDLVYLNGMWSVPFTIWPLRILKEQREKIILGVRGMLAPSAMAIKSSKKKLFLTYARTRKYYAGICFHATTEQEASEVKMYFGKGTKVMIAPNLPRKTGMNPSFESRERVPELRVISIARIAPEKNTLFALEALAKCTAYVNAVFYGTVYDNAYFEKCKAVMIQLPPNVKVEFRNALPSEHIHETVSQYDLFFLPSRGENFGHVILESLQSSVPVLISDKTPWKDLEQKNAGWDLPLNAGDFARKLEQVAALDSKRLNEFRKGAFELAKQYSTNPAIINATRKLFS